MTQARIGILGGTFDPIHLGHLHAAESVREQLALERVILVPSAAPPHKVGTPDAPLAPAALRLAWVRAAVAERPGLSVDALELSREGPSYTVDTLRSLAARVAPERPVFAIGDEAFALFASWREPREVLTLAHFAVMTRPPGAAGSLHEWLPASLREDLVIADDGRSARHRWAGTWIRTLSIDALPISSSEVRARLRDGRSVRYLLPAEILAAVTSSGIYAEAAPAEAGASR